MKFCGFFLVSLASPRNKEYSMLQYFGANISERFFCLAFLIFKEIAWNGRSDVPEPEFLNIYGAQE
jgi:hypothetical protein